MAMMLRARRATVLLLMALLLLPVVPAVTQEAVPRLAIEDAAGERPATFAVTVEPGAPARVGMRLAVDASGPVEAVAWVAGVVPPVNGGIVLTSPGAGVDGPARWLRFEDGPVTLTPGEPLARTVTVAVPAGTAPGLYLAGIGLEATAPVAGQVPRASALVAITVPGEFAPGFELGEPSFVQRNRGGVVQVAVRNTGTVPVSPQGSLTLRTAGGDPLVAQDVRMGLVPAGATALLEVPLEPLPPPGDHVLGLDLADADTGVTATLADVAMVVPEGPEGAGAPPSTAPLATEPAPDPATPAPTATDQPARSEVQFVDATVRADGDPVLSVFVEAHIANTGSPVGPARLTLVVTHNGRNVEEAVIADQVSLVRGITTVSTRYAPPDGFDSGIWTFALRLEAVDGDVATPIVETGTVAKIDVP